MTQLTPLQLAVTLAGLRHLQNEGKESDICDFVEDWLPSKYKNGFPEELNAHDFIDECVEALNVEGLDETNNFVDDWLPNKNFKITDHKPENLITTTSDVIIAVTKVPDLEDNYFVTHYSYDRNRKQIVTGTNVNIKGRGILKTGSLCGQFIMPNPAAEIFKNYYLRVNIISVNALNEISVYFTGINLNESSDEGGLMDMKLNNIFYGLYTNKEENYVAKWEYESITVTPEKLMEIINKITFLWPLIEEILGSED